MIVGARQGHDGIKEARFLKTEKNGIGAVFRAEAAATELIVGLAGIVFATRIAELGLFAAAALEDAQDIAGLGDFPAIQWFKFGDDALGARFFGQRRRIRFDGLRFAVAIVAFAEAGVLHRVPAIVVQRGAPQHSGVGHHAGGNGAGFGGVAAGGAAGFRRDA